MRFLLTDIKTTLFLHQKMLKKAGQILVLFLFSGIVFFEIYGKRLIYPYVYGMQTSQKIDTLMGWKIEHTQSQPIMVQRKDYAVQITPLKQVRVSGKVVYLDWYNAFGTFYRSNRYATIYDDLIPLDISLVSGQTASPQVVKQFEFKHEYRVLWARPLTNAVRYRSDEIHNIHTLPSSKSIYKGLQTVSVGDTVLLEGYLTETRGLLKDNSLVLRSAITTGEISNQLAGGQITGLCFQFYITKLIVNGFIFE